MAYNRKLLYTKSFPSWNTPEGNLGFYLANGSPITPIQLVATELKEPGSTITYAVTTGALPTGLTLSSSGEISGTLTGYSSAETISFTITATDDEGETALRNFNIQVSTAYTMDALVVAGGGGAGKDRGGGGGAGGYRYITGSNVNIGQTLSVVIGSGGIGTSSYNAPGGSGQNSSLIGGSISITSTGGGGGGGGSATGLSGGSGGGAGNNSSPGSGISGQGFAGGSLGPGTNTTAATGGGGGAGQIGGNSVAGSSAGNGGNGLQNAISGTLTYYAGGGGGGASSGTAGLGGLGGGGNGCANNSSCTGGSGVANTGSGGGGNGGGGGGRGGHGGSGIVILRMSTANYSGTTTGSPTVSTDGSDTILTYTGSGTYTS